MPLLSELREFKVSFANIGGQKANLEAKKVPYNDLKLPETEAESASKPEPITDMPNTASTAADTAKDSGAGKDTAAAKDSDAGIDDLNFSTFIDALPGDLSVPEIDDQPESDLYSPPPDELLSNLSDEIEPVSAAADSVEGEDVSSLANLDNLENFNFPETADEPALSDEPSEPDVDGALDLSVFDDLGDFGDLSASSEPDLPEEPAAVVEGETPDLGDFDLPEEPAPNAEAETPDMDLGALDELGDFDLPEEPAPAAEAETPDMDLGALDELGDLGLPEEPAAVVEGETPDLGDFDLPEEPAPAAEAETPDMDLGALDELGDLGLPEEPAAVVEGETPDLGDFDLPEEPAPAAEAEAETPDMDLGALDELGDLGLPEEPAAVAEGETPDLGDFDLPEEPAPAAEAEAETPDMDLGALDELGDLGLPEEPAAVVEGETPDLGDFDLPEEPASAVEAEAETPDMDLGALDELGDLGLPEEPAAVVEGETPDFGDFDLPEEPASAGSDMPEVGELDDMKIVEDSDLPEEPATADGSEIETQDSDEFANPEEPETSDENEMQGINLGNLDEQVSVDGLVDEASEDAYESFDPSGRVSWGKETGEAAADNTDSLDDIDDFSFPDLDSALGESQKDKKAPSGKAARKKSKRKSEIPVPEKEDEIELNDNELRYLQETLAGYPLNLRIACEEIIAEQDVRPEQMVRLIRNLIRGAPARETAALASEILDRQIIVPRGFEKSSVEALEAEKSSFAYIFVHNFLPILRLVTIIAILAASVLYLSYKFVYIPLKAESIYKMGYERIPEGEYQRANERFNEAFNIHRKKDWFYKYAYAFIDERQYLYAEQKYDELLRYYPRDKLGVLSYAFLETKYLRNYAKADSLLRHQILDYNPNDPDALLALGDNSLAWGEIDPSKYEDARFSYARLLDIQGQLPFIMERMMRYFIRTDNLKEVLPIWQWFDADPVKRPLGAQTLSELGGYLLDKQLEEVRGVPNEYVALIDGVRDILLRAVQQDPSLPEPHYHLARYYKNLGNDHEERVTLEIAIDRFEKAEEESLRRLTNRIDAHQRYADNLINSREFLHAEEQLQKGINLYDDAVSRRLLSSSPQYGRLYAGLGDLEYFVKTGDMEVALRYYNLAQQNGWAPPDMQYRMGSANYQLGNWQSALEHFFAASSNLPQNRRILFALGNAALKRGDYFAAQGYYNRLLDILENHRARLPLLLPNDRPDYLDLAERLMMARNNAGVANEMLAARTGSRVYQSRAMSLYSEAERAWDSLTRDPRSMVRSGSTSLPYLNIRNVLYPRQNYEPQMYMRIDREASESSRWEQLAPDFKD